MGKFLIGCDIGTSGAKAVIADEEGKVYGSCYVEYPLYSPRTGWFEHDPEDYWRVFKKKHAGNSAAVKSKAIRGGWN